MLEDKVSQAYEFIHKTQKEHNPVKVYSCFSGGHDSLVSTHLANSFLSGLKVLHINTGTGIKKTNDFVHEVCINYKWDLLEIKAKEDCGQDYEEMVIAHGFPGPGHHRKMYNRLKERAIRKATKIAKQDKKWNSEVLFISGVRADESIRRAGYKRVVSKVNSQVWLNPCYYWTSSDCNDYIDKFNLPKNPVREILGMSGECLCGAFAKKGELEKIRIVEPETAQRIENLEIRTRNAGHNWGYEDVKPSKKVINKLDQVQNIICAGCIKSKGLLNKQECS